MELPNKIYSAITDLTDKGNAQLDATNYGSASTLFLQALSLLPEPKTQWEAYTWLNASLADCSFHLKFFDTCLLFSYDALNGPDAVDNPFIHLRLGQAAFELNDMTKAKASLLKAYMLAGEIIFSEDDPKYKKLVTN
jgi:tetratricopeptide (TPR) repeat protein